MRLRSVLSDFFHQADLALLALCVASAIYGMVLIASATDRFGTQKFLAVQGAAMLLGIGLYILFSTIDVEALARKWKWLLAFNVGFICMLVPFGTERYGNKAWIQFSWMPTSVQPAEIVKLTFILLLARQLAWLWEERHELRQFSTVVQPAVHLLFMVGLIYGVSSDMGSALVYVFIFLCMALAAGMALRWFAAGLGAAAAGGLLLYRLGRVPGYMVNRFHAVLDHSFDPQGVGWQQTHSLVALGSGGWLGRGLFRGTQTQSGSLPFAWTDFIFSAAGEELGFVGCLAILVLLLAVVFRCLAVARRADSVFSTCVCVGMAGMLIFQTVENVGMCLFVMPTIGLTLPFFSYGGSSLVTLFAAMGIVSGIKMRTAPDRVRPR